MAQQGLGTGEALFKSGLPLWQRIFWTQLGLPSQLAVMHPAVNPSVKPTSLQKVETTGLSKASTPGGRWVFISLLMSPRLGKGKKLSGMSAAVKRRDQEGDRQLLPDSSFPHSSTQRKSRSSFRRRKHCEKLRWWIFKKGSEEGRKKRSTRMKGRKNAEMIYKATYWEPYCWSMWLCRELSTWICWETSML